MLPRCSCISRCGRRPCKPYRLSVFFGLCFRLSCMMPLIVGYKCSRPALPTVSAQSYTFFITIKKVCAHDNKGFTSRQKRFTLTMKKLAVGLCALTIKIFSLKNCSSKRQKQSIVNLSYTLRDPDFVSCEQWGSVWVKFCVLGCLMRILFVHVVGCRRVWAIFNAAKCWDECQISTHYLVEFNPRRKENRLNSRNIALSVNFYWNKWYCYSKMSTFVSK